MLKKAAIFATSPHTVSNTKAQEPKVRIDIHCVGPCENMLHIFEHMIQSIA